MAQWLLWAAISSWFIWTRLREGKAVLTKLCWNTGPIILSVVWQIWRWFSCFSVWQCPATHIRTEKSFSPGEDFEGSEVASSLPKLELYWKHTHMTHVRNILCEQQSKCATAMSSTAMWTIAIRATNWSPTLAPPYNRCPRATSPSVENK